MYDHTDCVIRLAAMLETYTDEQRECAEKAEAEIRAPEGLSMSGSPRQRTDGARRPVSGERSVEVMTRFSSYTRSVAVGRECCTAAEWARAEATAGSAVRLSARAQPRQGMPHRARSTSRGLTGRLPHTIRHWPSCCSRAAWSTRPPCTRTFRVSLAAALRSAPVSSRVTTGDWPEGAN
ncbi:hypothetical protein BU198_25355 [Streptomyces sp. CBMA156]|nr:hypothetical protein [Streptomyces sp. CBMA156]